MVVFPKLWYDTYGLWKELWTEIWIDRCRAPLVESPSDGGDHWESSYTVY